MTLTASFVIHDGEPVAVNCQEHTSPLNGELVRIAAVRLGDHTFTIQGEPEAMLDLLERTQTLLFSKIRETWPTDTPLEVGA